MSDRDDFEKWADPQGHRLEQSKGGQYWDDTAQAAFEAWQAGRAPLEAEIARLREALSGAVTMLELICTSKGKQYDYARSRGGNMLHVTNTIDAARAALDQAREGK